jgi:hypothetical protein
LHARRAGSERELDEPAPGSQIVATRVCRLIAAEAGGQGLGWGLMDAREGCSYTPGATVKSRPAW